MKKIFTLLLTLISTQSFGQNYNLSLEDWSSAQYYKTPQGWWETLNKIEDLNFNHSSSVVTCFQDTSHVDGAYSAKLVTKKYGTFLLPGTLTTGVLDITKQDLLPGKPFTQSITSLSGYYKYQPVNGDSALLYVHLSRWNTSLNKRDTLAKGQIIEKNTVSDWTSFTISLDELISGQTPDSINIIFTSSAEGAALKGEVGSTLWIDKISMSPTVAREKLQNTLGIQVFPNPASDELTISAQQFMSDAHITILDLTSKKVAEYDMVGYRKSISLDLPAGMYLLEVKQAQETVYTQKWICQP